MAEEQNEMFEGTVKRTSRGTPNFFAIATWLGVSLTFFPLLRPDVVRDTEATV